MNTLASGDRLGSLAPVADRGSRAQNRRRRSLRTAVATASEILWAALLLLVLAFLVSRGTALSAAVDDVAAAFHEARASSADESATEAAASQTQELAARLARDENHLALLERKYAELKMRLAPPAPAPKELEPPRARPVAKPKAAKQR